ncbi:MAG: hypothetical protein B6242_07060 [Anaerolineaceae bacterium 4572_78]|nr:MAG: hypothetical protein B6242_07060 [Anaerolineaceae bacterium 4572_78]
MDNKYWQLVFSILISTVLLNLGNCLQAVYAAPPVEHNDILPMSWKTSSDELSIALISKSENIALGSRAVFTITLRNKINQPINTIDIVSILPDETMFEVACSDECVLQYRNINVHDPFSGEEINIKSTRSISWHIPTIITHARKVLTYTAILKCQPNNASLKTTAYYVYPIDQYGHNAVGDTELQNKIFDPYSVKEGTWLSQGPYSCQAPVNNYELDWGDYDHDGFLDLAIASPTLGTHIFHNLDGDNAEHKAVLRKSVGVRWLEVITDNDTLELLTVGEADSFEEFDNNPGVNYIYSLNQQGVFSVTQKFYSENTLWRAAPADYDGDGDMDLAGIHYNQQFPCSVPLYKNRGGGDFISDGCILPYEPNSEQYYANDITWGDFNNDGYPDIAIGGKNFLTVFQNVDGRFPASQSIAVTPIFTDANYRPFDLAWGDFNRDGYLDLGVTFRKTPEIRIYPNNNGLSFGTPITISIAIQSTAVIDWGDWDKDGFLDIAVLGKELEIYGYDSTSNRFTKIMENIKSVLRDSQNGTSYAIRFSDYDNDGDLDLSFGDDRGVLQIFRTHGSVWSEKISVLNDRRYPEFSSNPENNTMLKSAESIAWGDINADEKPDIFLGAAGPTNEILSYGSFAFLNEEDAPISFGGIGPHVVALGDFDMDYRLDYALGTNDGILIYPHNNAVTHLWPYTTTSFNPTNVRSLAWGDSDDDGDLDLLVGTKGFDYILANKFDEEEQLFNLTPVWTSDNEFDTQVVAWGDFNRDRYLDFAVGYHQQGVQVFCNNRDGTFSQVWSQENDHNDFLLFPCIGDDCEPHDTKALAWVDADGDGDLDLSTGHNIGSHLCSYSWGISPCSGRDLIYQNMVCDEKKCDPKQPFEPDDISCQDIPNLPFELLDWTIEFSKTTAMVWSDWDGDGDLDWIIGHDGEPDTVYINSLDRGDPFHIRWKSYESKPTSGIAVVDVDGDGDEDLVVATKDGKNGIYYNNNITPPGTGGGVLASSFSTSLPNTPPSVVIKKVGSSGLGYGYATSEILSGPLVPTVTVKFKVYDPEGDAVLNTVFEYSINGGVTWHEATGIISPTYINRTRAFTETVNGQDAVFLWDAQQDQAIGDNIRFAVRILPHLGPVANYTKLSGRTGMHQFGRISATSPLFRVRGTTCLWPEEPFIHIITTPDNSEDTYKVGTSIQFVGGVERGSGVLDFEWDFGDGTEKVTSHSVQNTSSFQKTTSQISNHEFERNGVFRVRLTVNGESCPIFKEVIVTKIIKIGTGFNPLPIYLPLIFKNHYGTPPIGTPTITPTPTATPGKIYYETFDDKNSGWFEGSSPTNEDCISSYRDGMYDVELKTDGGIKSCLRPAPESAESRYGTFDVEAYPLAGLANVGDFSYGIYINGDGGDEYYLFVIYPNSNCDSGGDWILYRHDNDKFKVLISETCNPNVKRGTGSQAKNMLTIRHISTGQIDLYINQQWVGTHTDSDHLIGTKGINYDKTYLNSISSYCFRYRSTGRRFT